MYSSWYYLENLEPGENRVKVSLNANNHADWASNGKSIEDVEVVNISEKVNKNHQQHH